MPRGTGKKVPEAAVRVLRRTDNPGVMWGDSALLHLIAEEAGMPHDCWLTEKRVLDALSRYGSELFEQRQARGPRGWVRRFQLKGKADV